MQVEFALFCDAAGVSPDGLIDILRGGFDVVNAAGFPAKLGRMLLVVRLLCEPTECGQDHLFQSQMLDPRGNPVPTTEMEIRFCPPHYPGNPARRNRMTLRLDHWGLEFSEAGDYRFRFLVDGEQVGEAGIEMKLKPKLV